MKNLIGKVVGGCEILEEIGQGGMGVVYKARQISLERMVAMKALAQHLALDKNFVRRFQYEARAIARVSHPNILTIFDVGEENGVYYMVMEFIEGRSVAEMLGDIPRLDVKFSSDIIRQAALGLECAQQNGIIHRDIKPDNIMVTRQGISKVSDFGLAKEVEGSMTVTDAVMGTPAYMSPEQCDGKKLDGRTDVYSLGGTFYRMITGRLPFEAETAMSMMYRHKHEPLTPPHELLPDISAPVSNVIVKMMAKQRDERYQSMGAVVQAIDAAWREAQGAAAPAKRTSAVLEATIKLDAPEGQVDKITQEPPAPVAVAPDPERAKELLAEAESAFSRGDVAAAARLFGEAAKYDPDSSVVRRRLASVVTPEVARLVEAGKKMLVAGQYSEALRSFRNAADLDPGNQEVQELQRRAEERLIKKREAINEIRNLIREARFEEVVSRWNALPAEARERNVEKQVERIRTVTIPALQLVKQADAAQAAGNLDEAHELYQKVISLDANNQRAKEGIKEIERRRSRLEAMVREGYDAFMNRDFERAVDVWKNALKIAPDAQIKKRIIEAYLELAGELAGKEGGLARTVKIWEDVLAIDPDNAVARSRLPEDRQRLERASELSDKASSAFSRGQYGKAARAWQALLALDPHNKKVTASLRLARRRRFYRRLRLLVTSVFLFALAAAGAVFYTETTPLRKARQALEAGDAEAAQAYIGGNVLPFLILRAKKQELERLAHVAILRQRAEEANERGQAAEALKMLEKAMRQAGGAEQKRLERRMHEMRCDAALASLKKALEARDFAAAAAHAKLAANEAPAAGREKEAADLERKARLYELLAAVEAALQANVPAETARILKEACLLNIEDPFLTEYLKATGYDFRAAEDELRRGLAAVGDGRYREARELLAQVALHDPARTEATVLLAFVADALYCEQKGMVLVPPRGMASIISSLHWRDADRHEAFCIDRFEYPNRAGELPVTGLTYLEAKALCARQGKRLCTISEWAHACSTARGIRYGYGAAYVAGRCNVGSGRKAFAGAYKDCVNPYGVYDMVGNVAEWTRNPTAIDAADRQFIAGGDWLTEPAQEASCFAKSQQLPVLSSGTVGFRCCSDLPGTPPQD